MAWEGSIVVGVLTVGSINNPSISLNRCNSHVIKDAFILICCPFQFFGKRLPTTGFASLSSLIVRHYPSLCLITHHGFTLIMFICFISFMIHASNPNPLVRIHQSPEILLLSLPLGFLKHANGSCLGLYPFALIFFIRREIFLRISWRRLYTTATYASAFLTPPSECYSSIVSNRSGTYI